MLERAVGCRIQGESLLWKWTTGEERKTERYSGTECLLGLRQLGLDGKEGASGWKSSGEHPSHICILPSPLLLFFTQCPTFYKLSPPSSNHFFLVCLFLPDILGLFSLGPFLALINQPSLMVLMVWCSMQRASSPYGSDQKQAGRNCRGPTDKRKSLLNRCLQVFY